MIKAQRLHYQTVLQKMLEDLRANEKINASAADVVELDQTRLGRLSRMDAMQGQAISKDIQRRRKADVVRIEAALERLVNYEYGDCLRCDEPIAEDRLDFDPACTLCIDCARENE